MRQYLECTVVHTGYHPLRNGDPFLPPTAPIGTGTDTSTSRYQTTSLLASGASTELLLEQSTWVARARGRATFEGSFRRHEAGCRFVHFCEHTFAPLFQSFRLRRLVLFAFVLPMPPKSRAEAAASRAARVAARSNRSPAAAPSPAARGDTPGEARTPLSRLAPQASGTVATPGSIASVVSRVYKCMCMVLPL